ncbi:lysozyme inhibitor LprI family protein [Xanthobacter sp. TB0139]|uniref:lysozyme inhibitor LprI family protein n=1 Tax=Xanthobacter sp. TB0139 TaxID=3459178 RepID=UPI0040399723
MADVLRASGMSSRPPGRVPASEAAEDGEEKGSAAGMGEALCPRDEISPRAYNRCLFDATQTSEKALDVALTNALTVISRREDLAAVQRNAWRNLLEEAQHRFVMFRNYDCQSVAPFEGPRGIGNFERRALCLIAGNHRRAQALYRRYGVPGQIRPGAGGPAPQLGSWTLPGYPTLQ